MASGSDISIDNLICEAKDWTENGNTRFELIATSKSEPGSCKLSFACDDISFYVQYDKGTINVWSDHDGDGKVISYLSDVLEYISSSKQRSIKDILNKINHTLLPLLESQDDDEEDDDDDADFDNYYEDDDHDAAEIEVEPPDSNGDGQQHVQRFVGSGSSTAVQRLHKDLDHFVKSQGKFAVTGEPRGDNLFIWDVKLTEIPTKTQLGQDLMKYAKKYNREPCICMEMVFPADYPMNPPFVRVIRPRLKFLTGHVTIGGSICMEMLTRSGWVPTMDIESILVSIRAEILSDPSTRLDHQPDREYTNTEAKQAFDRMVHKYGWDRP